MLDCSSSRSRTSYLLPALDTDPASVAVLLPGGGSVSYSELAERVRQAAVAFGTGRRLVVLAARNDLGSLVTYLAALHSGCPLLLAGGDDENALEALVATYDPDVVVTTAGDLTAVRHRRDPGAPSPHDLHRDLALMLSTSGSTGSPKVVRLSHTNLRANAESIATYLGLAADDRAMTTLPMNYCYGLSVLNSHLVRGASVVLSQRSVIEAEFWEELSAAGATSFAGVPYTFELLDRIGFADMALPHLRHVTQAGGRMPPATVCRYAGLGARRGWRFFVMYGQTEATARMAYLPPEAAIYHPEAIGLPVPGGRFELIPVDGHDDPAVGELVYEGENVMLGYAERPADLARGRTTDVLHTGDLARRNEAGLYEIVGRKSRFLKLFGLRLDLDRIEAVLGEAGYSAACTGDDDRLVIACAGGQDPDRLVGVAAGRFHLPATSISVCRFDSLPRLANGKLDHGAIAQAAAAGAGTEVPPTRSEVSPPTRTRTPSSAGVEAVFAEVFPNRTITDDSTFVDLGGDSLSYVEMSIRLEEALGHLPNDWPNLAVGRMDAKPTPPSDPLRTGQRRRSWRSVEASVVVRAVAVVSVVAGHAGLVRVRGGAHVLLALAGFNFARFQLAGARSRAVRPRLMPIIGRIAIPTVAWTAVLLATTDDYGAANLALINSQIGEPFWDQRWRYWYVEAIVAILVVLVGFLAIPAVRRLERREPFRFALGFVTLALALRLALVDLGAVTRVTHRPQTVLWIFALGWLAAVADTGRRRCAVGLITAATVPSFFVNDTRSLLVVAGVVILVWVPTVRLPAPARALSGVLASASLYIYLLHWQVYPAVLAGFPPAVAVVASLIVGVAGWRLSALATAGLGRRLSARRPRRARSHSASSVAADAIAPAHAG